MPAELEKIYGRLGLAAREVYANFVESIDGVVALGAKPSAGSAISGRNQADRFVMGLLRAFADASPPPSPKLPLLKLQKSLI